MSGWFAIDDALAEFRGHLSSLRLRQIQLRGDLLVRQIQAQQIRAQHPNPQRLMMSREDGVGKIIETTIAITATISLATNFESPGCVSPVPETSSVK